MWVAWKRKYKRWQVVVGCLLVFAGFNMSCADDSDKPQEKAVTEDADYEATSGVRVATAPNDYSDTPNAIRPECPVAGCDPRKQDRAAGTCSLKEDATVCLTSMGDTPEGQACTTPSECEPDLACFKTKQGNRCQRICCPGNDDPCADNQKCGGSGQLVEGSETLAWGFCTSMVEGCEVFNAQESCELGEACYITSAQGDTACLRQGTASEGETCAYEGNAVQNVCASGMVCVAGMTCQNLCQLGDDVDHGCNDKSNACVAVSFAPEHIGLCM